MRFVFLLIAGLINASLAFGQGIGPASNGLISSIGPNSRVAIGPNSVGCPAGTFTIILTSASVSPLPLDPCFNPTNNKIEVIGGGGTSAWGLSGTTFGSAGCGGAYSTSPNVVLTPGTSIQFHVGAAGAIGGSAGSAGGAGGDSWFNGASLAASSVGAKGGGGGLGTTAATCAQALASAGIGATKFSGGIGGFTNGGAAGGGAAGPNGAGANGGTSSSSGGAGGGGSGGGANGTNSTSGAGAAGGNNFSSLGSGAGGAIDVNGSFGTVGGGAGGGGGSSTSAQPGNGGAGGNGIDMGGLIGAGGGGGAGGSSTGTGVITTGANGGAGGLYGAGGGVNGIHAGSQGTPGAGAPGIIRITWTNTIGQGIAPVTYYLSPSGNDGNDGKSIVNPWLTPNHSLNCGDVILAAAGTYNAANFQPGAWGFVTNCPSASGIYLAQVKCVGPSLTSCTISDSTHNSAVWVDQSNWLIGGFEATSTNTTIYGSCFLAEESTNKSIHHVAFVNDVANGCNSAGFSTSSTGQFGVDYIAVVGAIAWNASPGSIVCGSGVSFYEPVKSDSVAGTHIFTAGLFSFGNINPATCAGTTATDGNGIIYDDWAHSQQLPHTAYDQQGVIEQSMFLGNGARGIEAFINSAASMYFFGNTTYGNFQATALISGAVEGEITFDTATATTQSFNNLAQASVMTIGASSVYACYVKGGNATNTVNNNYCFGVSGQNTQAVSSTGFSFGTNTLATPSFVSTTVPTGVPAACATSALVPACMAATIANFTATAGGAAGLGYQPPGPCTPDTYYPVWLKGVVPDGLITKPCGM